MVKFWVVVVKWQIIAKPMNQQLLQIYIIRMLAILHYYFHGKKKKKIQFAIPSIGQKLKSLEFRAIKSYGSKFVDKFPNRFWCSLGQDWIMGLEIGQTIYLCAHLNWLKLLMMATNTCLLSCKLCGAKCKPT